MSNKKPRGYWQNYDNCYNEAKKYNTLKEFKKHCVKGYKWSIVNGWLKDFDWLQRVKLFPNGYWQNYDNCFNEAKKYSKLKDFKQGSAGAFKSAENNGWLKDYVWLEKVIRNREKTKGYWLDYNNCYKEALKYTCKSDYSKNASRAYNVSLNNGWINDYYWFRKPLHIDDEYSVYVYEDIENKTVYVGLTCSMRKNIRHQEHKNKNDTVANYFHEELPNPKYRMVDISAEDAQYYEDWYKKKYQELGWKVLNKAKTGIGSSSLGGCNVIWDYDKCKEEASKYSKVVQFKNNNCSAYNSALRNGWVEEFFPNKKKHGYWTKEMVFEESRKYKLSYDFQTKSRCAYLAACKKGWLKEIDWLEKRPRGRKSF